MIAAFFMRHWEVFAVAIGVLSALVIAYGKGAADERVEWEIAKAKQAIRQVQISNEVSNEYQKELTSLHDKHNRFVRMHLDSLRIRTACGPDATAGREEFHGVVREFHRKMLQADIQAERLEKLQKWVNRTKE